jgi:hypothetical protein
LNQGLQDYFLTDNGFFIEIDREDNSKPGSRIIGLYHLDSLRCWRTGDPDVPVIYSDLHGQYHFLAWWQVWSIADTPNARNNYFGVGFRRRLPYTNASGAWWRSACSSIKG